MPARLLLFGLQNFSAGNVMQNVAFYFLVIMMLAVVIVQLNVGHETGTRRVISYRSMHLYQDLAHFCNNAFFNVKRLFQR